MYESEINSKVETAEQIPSEVLKAFSTSREVVSMRTVLPWGEHCTECVWPTCYATCDLYEARPGGNCRRFMDGMVRIDSNSVLGGYLLKIRFKQWGKLWTVGNIRLRSISEAEHIESRDYKIGSMIQTLIMPEPVRNFVSAKRYSFKKRVAQAARLSTARPSSFMLECFNPGEASIQISLTIRSQDPLRKIPYQALLEVRPGFNRIKTPVQDINAVVPLEQPFGVELIPNDVPDGTTLYFGTMEFVLENALAEKKPQQAVKVKCVVWDLDNTLWDGILVEDGSSNLRLKPGIRDMMIELDRRGILQSVASKNNFSEAMDVLKAWGLEQYFLFPQISWNPKSESVSGLLSRPEFDVPVTAESANRRKMYQLESERQVIADSFGDDFRAFLKHCNIRVGLASMTKENIARVHELTQRTNQMNFSGNRYDRARLEEILASSHLDTYVIKCEDKFGSYGVVGFAIVDSREPRLTDLMFSCRIQAKRVEHAFLAHIIHKYLSNDKSTFYANYRRTDRNEPSGRVFADLGFEESGISDGVSLLSITRNAVTSDDGIIHIVDNSNTVPA